MFTVYTDENFIIVGFKATKRPDSVCAESNYKQKMKLKKNVPNWRSLNQELNWTLNKTAYIVQMLNGQLMQFRFLWHLTRFICVVHVVCFWFYFFHVLFHSYGRKRIRKFCHWLWVEFWKHLNVDKFVACESKNLAEEPCRSIVLRKCLEINSTRVSIRIENMLKITIIVISCHFT